MQENEESKEFHLRERYDADDAINRNSIKLFDSFIVSLNFFILEIALIFLNHRTKNRESIAFSR